MAWDIILNRADQTLNCQDSNVHLLTISHSVDNMRLWYFTLKRHLVQYQFSSSRVKIDFFRKFSVYSPASYI